MENNKVYLVWEDVDNCQDYESHSWDRLVIAVCRTKEKAESIVSYCYNKLLTENFEPFGDVKIIAKPRYNEDGNIDNVLVDSEDGSYCWTQDTGSYSYYIEERELDKFEEEPS